MAPKRRPDSNQIAALIVAKAAGIEPPKGAKEFEHYVRKVSAKKTPKKRK